MNGGRLALNGFTAMLQVELRYNKCRFDFSGHLKRHLRSRELKSVSQKFTNFICFHTHTHFLTISTFSKRLCLNVSPLITKGFLNAIVGSLKITVVILLDFRQGESFFYVLVSQSNMIYSTTLNRRKVIKTDRQHNKKVLAFFFISVFCFIKFFYI